MAQAARRDVVVVAGALATGTTTTPNSSPVRPYNLDTCARQKSPYPHSSSWTSITSHFTRNTQNSSVNAVETRPGESHAARRRPRLGIITLQNYFWMLIVASLLRTASQTSTSIQTNPVSRALPLPSRTFGRPEARSSRNTAMP